MPGRTRVEWLSSGLLALAVAHGAVTVALFPSARVELVAQVVVEGTFLAVVVAGLVALPRLVAREEVGTAATVEGVFVPLLVGFGGYLLRGVTDVLDELLAVPDWYLSVFKDGALIAGSVAFVVGLVRWSRVRAERERALQERERQLETRNRQLETFASVVSHDLRNPLAVAEGYAGELDDGDPGEAIRESLARMETIIEDVLALSRLGEDAIDPEPVSLADVAADAWAGVATDDTTLDTDDATIPADPSQFRQLLENLFRNAVEHGPTNPRSEARGDAAEHGSTGNRTESGDAVEHGSTSPPSGAREDAVEHGVDAGGAATATDGDTPSRPERSLTVRVGPLDDDGFYVEDTGVGIPPDERSAVLEPGHSEDGTGLGLAIVTEIAEAHGWTVAVDESEEGGARFAFRTG